MNSSKSTKEIGIVVPTLGIRIQFLEETLRSIRAAGDCHITVVSPVNAFLDRFADTQLFDEWVSDPMQGLVEAINHGIRSLPKSVEFVNWLGDDDTLAPNSLLVTSTQLEMNPEIVCVFGKCQYVNEVGQPIWMNKSGRFAIPLMRFGPQLIPQPGALFRRTAFDSVGGLNSRYKLAFDLDLLFKLKKVGRIHYVAHQLSTFRWHSESLSVSSREISVSEASQIRKTYLPKLLRGIAPVWEIPISYLILFTGKILTSIDNLKNSK